MAAGNARGRERLAPAQALAEAEAALAAGKPARASALLLKYVVAAPGGDPAVQVAGFLLLSRMAQQAGRRLDAAGYLRCAALRAEQAGRPDLMAAVESAG